MLNEILEELESKGRENGYIFVISKYSSPWMHDDSHEFIEDVCNEYIDEIEEVSGINIQEALNYMTEDTAIDTAKEYGATLYKVPYIYNDDLDKGDYDLYGAEEVDYYSGDDSDVEMDEYDGVDDD